MPAQANLHVHVCEPSNRQSHLHVVYVPVHVCRCLALRTRVVYYESSVGVTMYMYNQSQTDGGPSHCLLRHNYVNLTYMYALHTRIDVCTSTLCILCYYSLHIIIYMFLINPKPSACSGKPACTCMWNKQKAEPLICTGTCMQVPSLEDWGGIWKFSRRTMYMYNQSQTDGEPSHWLLG